MKKVIYRYELKTFDNIIEMPIDAKILKIAHQGRKVYIWAEHEWADPIKYKKRRFFLIGTGNRFESENMKYQATIIDPGDIWHIYEVV